MRLFHGLQPLRDEIHFLFLDRADDSRGRLCLLVNSTCCNVLGMLTGGAFYTGFMLGNGISATDIGVITALPYLTSLLCLLSPVILERFPRRKLILAVTRVLYYVINIVGVTLVPVFVHDTQQRIFWFGAMVLAANCINSLFNPGYTPWHLNFLPNNVRAAFFTVRQFCMNLVGCSAALVSSILTDALQDSPYQLTVITVLRYVGFLFAVIDVISLCLPREYPYEVSSQKRRLFRAVSIPLKNRRFLATIGLYCLYSIANNATAGIINAYLLSTVGVSYFQIMLLNALYSVFFLLLSSFWQRLIRRWGWLRVFGVACLLLAPTDLCYMFLRPGNALWLYSLLRLCQHAVGVGYNVTAENLIYLNMPVQDRTSYVSMFTLLNNASLWLAIMGGTWFVALVGEFRLALGPCTFDGFQLLSGIVTLLCLVMFVLAVGLAPRLEPKER